MHELLPQLIQIIQNKALIILCFIVYYTEKYKGKIMIIKIIDSSESINNSVKNNQYIIALDKEKLKDYFVYFNLKLEDKIINDEVELAPSEIDFFTNYKNQDREYNVFFKPISEICFINVLNGKYEDRVKVISMIKEEGTNKLIFNISKEGI